MENRKKILIVEDERINREILRSILADQYDVLEAENGEVALSILKQQGSVAIILLDIGMPVMDGYTFLSVVKKDISLSAIPIIVTTQSDGDNDEVVALSLGATDYVVKPYKPQVILHRIANLISLSSMQKTMALVSVLKTDQLTGLYSRQYYYQCVRDVLIANPDKKYDIICSDIEGFKFINDAFGTDAADRLLCIIAELYLKTVGEQGICARLEADRFSCLIERKEEYTDDMFRQIAHRLKDISKVNNVVIDWGIYHINSTIDSVTVEQMCDRALLAAQSIKGKYDTYFAVYDDKLRSELRRKQQITDSMKHALASRQFEVYLQPKYSIKDNTLVGAEALVRWNHPEWGMQSPAEFIPLFEKNGFITKLDIYVWEEACAILHRWDKAGFPPIPISVNVSRADIYQSNIISVILDIVRKYNLQPQRLHLEITESAYSDAPNQIVDAVKKLRSAGFVIEMDDFGSGYSSLNMFAKLPIDILKLDMRFLQDQLESHTREGIMKFIMNLARHMNLVVTAEGVETVEQVNYLRDIGCDYAQGYHYAKPMPVEQFEKLLLQN